MAAELRMSFLPKMNWTASFSPVKNPEQVKKDAGIDAVTIKEYKEKHGEHVAFIRTMCNMLWAWPQINSDGRVFGCCRFIRRDFGKNAFTDGVLESINSEELIYARKMLMGLAPDRGSNQCSDCYVYHEMVAEKTFIPVEFVRDLVKKTRVK
jgi:hypothetical protein